MVLEQRLRGAPPGTVSVLGKSVGQDHALTDMSLAIKSDLADGH